jgi:hypothetical protein
MLLGRVRTWALFFSLAGSIARAKASPDPLALPDQSTAVLNNNAPFSGAIYIVNSGSSGSSCPADAEQVCASGATTW